MRRMGLLCAFLLLLTGLFCAQAGAEGDFAPLHGYIYYTENGLCGLKNEAGEVVLPAQYTAIEPPTIWADGVARAVIWQDQLCGWFPTAAGGPTPCQWEKIEDSFGNYVLTSRNYQTIHRLLDLNGKDVLGQEYAFAKVLTPTRLALKALLYEPEDSERDGSGGVPDDAISRELIAVDTQLHTVFSLTDCVYIAALGDDLLTSTLLRNGENVSYLGTIDGKTIDVPAGNFENFGDEINGLLTFLDYAADSREGLLRKDGQVLVPAKYRSIALGADGYSVLIDSAGGADGFNNGGYDCILIDADARELCRFHSASGIDDIWANKNICVSVNAEGLYELRDHSAAVLSTMRYIGAPTADARIRFSSTENRWGYLDESGKVAIAATYYDAADFCEGLAAVRMADGRWSYIDTAGNTAFDGAWDAAEPFANGTAWVRSGGVDMLIDKQGRDLGYRRAQDAATGTSATDANGGTAAIARIYTTHNGLAVCADDAGMLGVCDDEGTLLGDISYTAVEPAEIWPDGVARCRVYRGGSVGLIGADGSCIDAVWAEIPFYFGGRFCALGSENALYRFLNPDGSFADDALYSAANLLDDGLCSLVPYGDNGGIVVDERFATVFSAPSGVSQLGEGLYRYTAANSLCGIVDGAGNILAEATYSTINRFSDGYALARSYDERGTEHGCFLATDGSVALAGDCYDILYDFCDGYAVARVSKDKDGSKAYVVFDTALREVLKFNGNYFDCREGRVFYDDYDKNQTVIADMSGNIRFATDSLMPVGKALSGEMLYSFRDGESGLYGLCDADGNVRVPARFGDINSLDQGIAIACLADTEKWVFINELGDIVLSGSWTGIWAPFDENGVACVMQGTNEQDEIDYLYIDRDGCPLGPNRRADIDESW